MSDDVISYLWFEDEEPVAQTKNLEHMFSHGGAIGLKLTASQGDIFFDYYFTVFVEYAPIDPPAEGRILYHQSLRLHTGSRTIYQYAAAVRGGDTQETMNQESIGRHRQ